MLYWCVGGHTNSSMWDSCIYGSSHAYSRFCTHITPCLFITHNASYRTIPCYTTPRHTHTVYLAPRKRLASLTAKYLFSTRPVSHSPIYIYHIYTNIYTYTLTDKHSLEKLKQRSTVFYSFNSHPVSHGVLRVCMGFPEKEELLTNMSDFLGLVPLPPYSGARSGERHGAIPSPESHPLIG